MLSDQIPMSVKTLLINQYTPIESKNIENRNIPTGTFGWTTAILNKSFNSFSLAFSSSFFFCTPKSHHNQFPTQWHTHINSNKFNTFIDNQTNISTHKHIHAKIQKTFNKDCTFAASLEGSGLGIAEASMDLTYFWTFLLLFLFLSPNVLSSTDFCFFAISVFDALGAAFGGIFELRFELNWQKSKGRKLGFSQVCFYCVYWLYLFNL